MNQRLSRLAAVLGASGAGLTAVLLWMVFFWVPTEIAQGVVQRIFYVHVPAAWVAFLAFGMVAICSASYLWRRDDRFDLAAASAAEGGMIYTFVVLLTGPLWARVAWGTWWVWEPKLTLTLLLWFIYIGYFLVRASTGNSQRGKRFSAVLGIVGALDMPLIYFSVVWFRSLHPGPVVIKSEETGIAPQMLATLLVGLAATTLVFLSLFLLRYRLARIGQVRACQEVVDKEGLQAV
jgi:heme exporter protein C